MKQYVYVKDLRGNTTYINKEGRLSPDINDAYGMNKRAAAHVITQLEAQKAKPGSAIASFGTRDYRTR